MSRLCVENLGNSMLLPALFALIRNISSRHPSGPELIRGSLKIIDLNQTQEIYHFSAAQIHGQVGEVSHMINKWLENKRKDVHV